MIGIFRADCTVPVHLNHGGMAHNIVIPFALANRTLDFRHEITSPDYINIIFCEVLFFILKISSLLTKEMLI